MKANYNKINKYIKVNSQILNCHLSPMELSVYLCLKSFKNSKTDIAIVKYKTLANRLKVSTQSIARSIKSLSKKGLIIPTKRYTIDGYNLCYSYQFRSFLNGFNVIIPYDVLGLSPSAIYIYTFINTFGNKLTGLFSISLRKISKKTEISLPTVISAINTLEDYGLISKRYYLKLDGGLGINHYTITAITVSSPYGNYNLTKIRIKQQTYIIEFAKSNKQDIITQFKTIKVF